MENKNHYEGRLDIIKNTRRPMLYMLEYCLFDDGSNYLDVLTEFFKGLDKEDYQHLTELKRLEEVIDIVVYEGLGV